MLNKLISISTNKSGNSTDVSIGNLGGSMLMTASISPRSGQGVISQLRDNLNHLDIILSSNNLSRFNIIRIQVFTKDLNEEDAIQEELYGYFYGKPAAFSIIPQPPAYGEDCLLEVHISELHPKRINRRLSILEFEDTRWAFLSGITPKRHTTGPCNQSMNVFLQAKTMLEQIKEKDFSFGQVARAWIYQKDIIEIDNRIGENYQNMNNARAEFFKNISFKIGNPNPKFWNEKVPPASTGIDMADGSILLEAIAVATRNALVAGYPVSNPFQRNPFEYHETVLQKGEAELMKAPPAFSRGFSVITPKGESLFISGTASVEGEDVLHPGDTKEQTKLAIKNMLRVAEQRNMTLDQFFSTRVYIAKPSGYSDEDFERARDIAYTVVKETFPHKPTLFLKANVCRKAWLFEIEAWAGFTN